jgi:hypothetical protein
MSDKLEVATPAWMTAITAAATRIFSDLDRGTGGYSVMEVFTDIPNHISPNAPAGFAWHVRISAASIDIGPGVLENPDLIIEVKHSVAQALGRLAFGGDPEEQAEAQAGMKAAMMAGEMKYIGDGSKMPPAFAARMSLLHDEMAASTA